MKFIVDNTQYRISFGYETVGINEKQRRTTIARIKMGERDSPTDLLVSEGRATLNPTDTFRYETGRKMALRHALVMQSDEFRLAVWNAYHSREGGIWANKETTDASQTQTPQSSRRKMASSGMALSA